ncbi:MAG: hypothetical protein HY817_05260 [Candidatus Abawacabacteria bacterium]|nr:hypothetical protein [Candidatus Abawacabacteria bacterium]
MAINDARIMKRYLLVQTAFAYPQVVLIEEGKVARIWDTKQTRETLQFLMRVLADIEDVSIDALIFIHGPGSFTALRVGATWVNTLAFVKKMPIYQIDALTYIAMVTGIPKDSIAITYDSKRFFLTEKELIVESPSAPQKHIINPDQNPIMITNETVALLIASLTDSVTQTDVLYIVPPKITLPRAE